MRTLLLSLVLACGGSNTGGDDSSSSSVDATPGAQDEVQPAPAEGAGFSDPVSRSLHNQCGGVEWQRVHGWLLEPNKAPKLDASGDLDRCIARYAGWVTNEADAVTVSRASVYAALVASDQCTADGDYDGRFVTEQLCKSAGETDVAACIDRAHASRAAGIATLAKALGNADALKKYDRDPPLAAAWLASGAVKCGGTDRWKLDAPAGWVERYVAATNAYKALSAEPPVCGKRIVVSVALYTGMDDPGVDGVAAANGCWTYERIAKTNEEWKICNYDGTVNHPAGFKWVYDDTNTAHAATTERNRIAACKANTTGRGYIYMVNRGSGWPKVVTEGVAVHFAEIYSGQFTIDDQFSAWKAAGSPGEPMINIGEPTTSAAEIRAATLRACKEVKNNGHLGIYIYPESLRGERMSALVNALDDCTK